MPPAPSRPAPAALARWRILRGATAMMVLTGLCAPRGNEDRPVRDYTLSSQCARPYASVTLLADPDHHHSAHDVALGREPLSAASGRDPGRHRDRHRAR